MTRVSQLVFAALVVATLAAFLVAQQLKSTPALVQDVGASPLFSPNQDGRLDRATIAFSLKQRDAVDVTVTDDAGDAVRTLASGRELRRRRKIRLKWDGRDDAGRPVRDGTYGVRLALRRAGRSVALPRDIVLDTTPPEPRVLSVGPDDDPLPELLPRRDGEPAEIRFEAPGRRPEVEIWRTDRGPRPLTALKLPDLGEDGVGTVTWDGTSGGRRVAPGTFVAVVRSRDEAGNIGWSVPKELKDVAGTTLPGRAGISVRYLGVQPPVLPVRAREPIELAVDARGAPWTWTLRAVGERAPIRRGRRTRGGPFTLRAPGGEARLYLFEVRTRTRRAAVPVAVEGREKRPVLVVLPATTWQGRNPVDDDGDGMPNTLELATSARLDRVMARDGLPAGLTEHEGPLLAFLARNRVRFDLTTDVALAAGRGPRIEGHNGVLLAGDTVWLTDELGRSLRRFVASGGAVASLGTGSLRRKVRLDGAVLRDPTPAAPVDLFGSRLAPVREREVDITNLEDDPRIRLFEGGSGLFPGVDAWEETLDPGREGEAASTAVTPESKPVIVALRFGRGLVIRPGIRAFATRLSSDPASSELVLRTMTLLRAARPER